MTAEASKQIIVARTRFRHSRLVDRILFVDVAQQPFLERLQVPYLCQCYPWRGFVRAPFLAYRATAVINPCMFGTRVAAGQGRLGGFVRNHETEVGAVRAMNDKLAMLTNLTSVTDDIDRYLFWSIGWFTLDHVLI